ncbi:MAG: ParB N-terminal domain-containing protein, partial [Pseudomonadota bacterium]
MAETILSTPIKRQMLVQEQSIDKIIPYARNARVISDSAVDKVAASIKEFGWRQPIVVDCENVIVCGHTRFLAAKKLGLENVPVHVATDLSTTQIKAYRLADNRVHEESTWDTDLLALELEELGDLDFNLDLTGFNADEINILSFADINSDSLCDEDETPELQTAAISLPGDVWKLGRHNLICGDCTEWKPIDAVIKNSPPDIIFTDPPYGINLLGKKPSKFGGGGKVYEPIKGDDKDFDPTFIIEHFPNLPLVLWGANYFSNKLLRGKWFVWDKQRPAGLDFSDCELAWSNLEGVKVK